MPNNELGPLTVTRKTGAEPFTCGGTPLTLTLADFWRWSTSDLVNNATRGILAEFVVSSALGVTDGVRSDWDAYDIKTDTGITVEVKSAAYVQSWHQKKLSKIEFSIGPTKAWTAATNEFAATARRQADVYVFALLKHQEKATVEPLNLDQWEFYVVPTVVLNKQLPMQKEISLTGLRNLEPAVATYDTLAAAVEAAAQRQAE